MNLLVRLMFTVTLSRLSNAALGIKFQKKKRLKVVYIVTYMQKTNKDRKSVV